VIDPEFMEAKSQIMLLDTLGDYNREV